MPKGFRRYYLLSEKTNFPDYHPPVKNPEYVMNDFYITELLDFYLTLKKMDFDSYIKQSPDQINDREFNILYSFDQNKKQLLKYLKTHLLSAVLFSINCEYYHVYDHPISKALSQNLNNKQKKFLKTYYDFKQKQKGSSYAHIFANLSERERRSNEEETKGEFNISQEMDRELLKSSGTKNYKDRFKVYQKTKAKLKYSDYEFVELSKICFELGSWSAAYGGKAWANICDAWLDLYRTALSQENKLYAAIDRIYDLQHNTGTVFNKVGLYYKASKGFGWIKKALDFKRYAKPHELISRITPAYKSMALALVKMIGFGTLEQFLGDKFVYKKFEQQQSQVASATGDDKSSSITKVDEKVDDTKSSSQKPTRSFLSLDRDLKSTKIVFKKNTEQSFQNFVSIIRYFYSVGYYYLNHHELPSLSQLKKMWDGYWAGGKAWAVGYGDTAYIENGIQIMISQLGRIQFAYAKYFKAGVGDKIMTDEEFIKKYNLNSIGDSHSGTFKGSAEKDKFADLIKEGVSIEFSLENSQSYFQTIAKILYNQGWNWFEPSPTFNLKYYRDPEKSGYQQIQQIQSIKKNQPWVFKIILGRNKKITYYWSEWGDYPPSTYSAQEFINKYSQLKQS